MVFATGGPITKPHPYCQECDEPLDWCIHGDGSAWANNLTPPAKPDQRVMRELQQNGWSLEGIARLYQITPFAAQMLIQAEERERESDE